MSDQLREALQQRLAELEKPVGCTLDAYDREILSAHLAPILERARRAEHQRGWADLAHRVNGVTVGAGETRVEDNSVDNPEPFAAAIRGKPDAT